MIVGAMSDTHLRTPDHVLEYILDELLAPAELILHAGDIVTQRVLEYLEERGVIAVCGNMDDYEIYDAVPQIRTVPAGGKRIGLIHGWGAREGLEKRILDRFRSDMPDLIVYGHSHRPYWGRVEQVLMFNPGAPNTRVGHPAGTVGLIEIIGDDIQAKFVPVNR